jgi:ABC-type nitrate/sulfonate/bicarbonate transport system ATPase subunit
VSESAGGVAGVAPAASDASTRRGVDWRRALTPALSLGVFVLLWAWVAGAVDSDMAPGPLAVAQAAAREIAAGDYFYHLMATLLRVTAAFLLAFAIGSAIGVALGMNRAADRAFSGWLVLFLNLPALVTIILCYVWFGLTELAAVTAVAINKIPNVAATLREGGRALSTDLAEMATALPAALGRPDAPCRAAPARALLRGGGAQRAGAGVEDRAGGRAAGTAQRGGVPALRRVPAVRRGRDPRLRLRVHRDRAGGGVGAAGALGATGEPVAAMSGLSVAIEEKRFDGASVLGRVAFDLAPGERAALLGPSGVGKSTLLSIVAGLDKRFSGAVRRPAGEVAMIFQTPRLLPWRTLAENVALPPGSGGMERARALLAQVGLAEAADLHPERVSLGMQRRAALARALAQRPALLLMDEPLVSLDPDAAAAMRALLTQALDATGAAALIATHDRREALALADRVLELEGRPATLARDRRSPLDRDARRDPSAVEALVRDWFGDAAA